MYHSAKLTILVVRLFGCSFTTISGTYTQNTGFVEVRVLPRLITIALTSLLVLSEQMWDFLFYVPPLLRREVASVDIVQIARGP